MKSKSTKESFIYKVFYRLLCIMCSFS